MELIEIIGYNPVIDVNWNNVEKQIIDILNHIDNYQEFVDKNYQTALKYASWDNRVDNIKEILIGEGYAI
jgi:hypothetical protein